ncbi:hypothetical protein HY494_00860 [Candidatus Woesearchaeota archaeon]|nr:hypothetical protein [Candidatus Woesearchaeota archaeon]
MVEIKMNAKGLREIVLAGVLSLGVAGCDKPSETSDDCAEIRNECHGLENQNREIYDRCQEIYKGYWKCFDIEDEELKNHCFLEVLTEYNKCEDERAKLIPLIDDCWNRYNDCFDRK